MANEAAGQAREYYDLLLAACRADQPGWKGAYRQMRTLLELLCRTQAGDGGLQLTDLAAYRGQTLAQMALAWCLRDQAVCSVIVGTSSLAQLQSNMAALDNLSFTDEELWLIGEQGA